MREKIYTIPISEAFEKTGICPFCTIETELDKRYTESALGAGMMEPDIRIMTNKKGFCKMHYDKLLHLNKALPLALVIQSHISENVSSIFDTEPQRKKSLFSSKQGVKEGAVQIVQRLHNHNNSCYICSRIDDAIKDYADTAVHMFKTEKEFKEKFKNTPSFCLKHTEILINAGIKRLGEKDFSEFFEALKNICQNNINSLYESVTEFANSFDYRAENKLSDKARSSISDSINLL